MTARDSSASDRFSAYWVRNDRAAILARLAWSAPFVLVLAILQPFETERLPFLIRAGYWAVLVCPFAALAGFLVIAVRTATHLTESWQLWLTASAAGSVLMVGPVKLMDWLLAVLIAPITGTLVSEPPLLDLLDTGELAVLYLSIFTIVGILYALPPLMLAAQGVSVPLDDVVAPRPGARFLDRLPPALGDELICINTEDHYLRVHTRLGDHMLLMRMSDAAAELADFPGLRVHRSWWIAGNAISEVRREGRRRVVLLDDGRAVPVSASYEKELARFTG